MGICYEFGPFTADPRERQLRREGRVIPLTPKVFDILVFLLQNPGRLLTKDELLEQVWPDTTVEEGNLARNISSLRSALAETRRDSRYIETVARRGYRFIADVQKASATPPTADSLAVLPLADEGLADESGYLASGLTSTLIDKLSRLPGLTVLSHSAVVRHQQSKGANLSDVAAVGRALGVRVVLAGRIGQTGHALRVDIELIDAHDSSHVWGAQYRRDVGDVLAIQESVASDVADRLRLRLRADDHQRFERHDTDSTEAHLLYLKGRFFFQKWRPHHIRQALELFERAVVVDPNYALAYVGLMDCHSSLDNPAETKRVARRALALDPLRGEAHASLAWAAFLYDWDWEGADRGFRRAIELSPNYPAAHHWYATFLASMGRHDEALREIGHARDLDPLSLLMSQTAGMVQCMARDYEQAVDTLRETIETDPGHGLARSTLGVVYVEQGRFDEAMEQFDTLLTLAGEIPQYEANTKALKGYACAAAGRVDEARALAHEVAALALPEPYWIATIYGRLGDPDRAFGWLERAYAARSIFLCGLRTTPVVDPLRSDPRFDDLLRRVGLSA